MTQPKSAPHLTRITPAQAYSFSRLVQKKALEDNVTPKLVAKLRGTKLKRLADEVIRYRDSSDLSEASRGARAIVRDLQDE